ncbi:T-complex protein 11-like protein 1 isoform X1 [Centruroides sculpturatus]|uniref:T-complex protein 11-like protein 1 isoform X1 n=1 Tax=Centruroides sculpturatus TaxID=218467 RepID=UPI000C6CC9FA|nr:T-complex protein 11-like protein 1 isoform X1 [Centruroides sculpturatus]
MDENIPEKNKNKQSESDIKENETCSHTNEINENNNKQVNYKTKAENDSVSEKEQESRRKVQHITIPSSPLGGILFPGVPASPPRFVSLEQIMKAANGVSNMVLAHEIAVNKDFVLEKITPNEDSLQGQVKNIVHKAFWDVLQSQLLEVPPNYSQAMVLLKDVKEGLLSLLLPHHTRIKTQICEVLDIDLIQQQVEHDALDFQHYAQYVLSIMSSLCAPVRDARIRELMTVIEILPLFKGIIEMLDLMKLDMANFTIQQIRPHIQQQSIEYERKKFQEFLETHAELADNVDGLECTREWLKRNYKKVMDASKDLPNNEEQAPSYTKILTSSYLELLEWDDKNLFPETLLIDQARFLVLRDQVYQSTLIASILLITYNTAGERIYEISDFKETLKNHLAILLEGIEKCSEEEVQNKLENVVEQVIQETKGCLEKHKIGELNKMQEDMLRGQIKDIVSPNNRVCKLIKNRILTFIEEVMTSQTASPVKVPTGLSVLQSNLSCTTGQFLRLVSHNRAVFGEYYADIINTIRHAHDN